MSFFNICCFFISNSKIMWWVIINITQILSNKIPNQNIFVSILLNFCLIFRIKYPIWKSIQSKIFPFHVTPIILNIILILNFITRFQNRKIILEMLRSTKSLHLMTVSTFMLLIFYFFVVFVIDIALLSAHWTVFFAPHVFQS